MSEYVKIKGGNRLTGTIFPVPNKNSILAALPVCLLTDEIIYKDLPDTTDVTKMLDMIKLLGCSVEKTTGGDTKVTTKNLNSYRVDKEIGSAIRSSIMFAGPLLARFGIAEIPVPGGCVLGKRSISAHVDVFTKAGIKIDFLKDGYVRFTSPKSKKSLYEIWQFESSVTGTENFLTYAAGTNSHFSLNSAACEPHIVELETLLKKMGANIEGVGSNKVKITGSNKLKNTVYKAGPDFVDISGLCVAAAVTKGKIRIKGGNCYDISGGLIDRFEKFNLKIKKAGDDLIVDGDTDLFIDAKNTGFPLAGENLPKLVPGPWPGFPVDCLPPMVTLACKTKGRILIQNWMYETGLDFIRELNAMGADIFMSDPQRIIVTGSVNFKGGKVTSPGVIQACKAIVLAALADPVETVIFGVEILKRRYPNVFENYKKMGAQIEGPFKFD